MRPIVLLGLALLTPWTIPAQERTSRRDAEPVATEHIKPFRIRSKLLSEFFGRDVHLDAGVVLPPARAAGEKLPVCYDIHGFGGSHRGAWRRGPDLVAAMQGDAYPRMLYVYLDAACARGHHEFADSVNNGPCGRALVEELIPALEREFDAVGRPDARFLTGHSSGGWSSLWLQITYPDVFGGTWSTAPDPVDFRDFTGIDIYAFANAYVDPDGTDIQLVRRGGAWTTTVRQFVERELASRPFGGQFSSFDYVFSPRGEDGRPQPLFDPKTGAIDRAVATAWEAYDIRLVLERAWPVLGPKLQGKLRIWIGEEDTFRLEGAVKLLQATLATLGSDAEILLVPGRDHGTLSRPHDAHWQKGMLDRVHREMRATFDRAAKVR